MEALSAILIFLVIGLAVVFGFPVIIYKFTAGEASDEHLWSEEEAKKCGRSKKKWALIISLGIAFITLWYAKGMPLHESVIYAFIPYILGSIGISAFIAGTPMHMPYSGNVFLRVRDSAQRSLLFLFHLFWFGLGACLLSYEA